MPRSLGLRAGLEIVQLSADLVSTALRQLLSAVQPTVVQVAAVRVLSSFPESRTDPSLLDSYRNLAPEAQQELIAAFSRGDRMPQLLAAMERGEISFAALRGRSSHSDTAFGECRVEIASAGAGRAAAVDVACRRYFAGVGVASRARG